jgi:hypothetical protein
MKIKTKARYARRCYILHSFGSLWNQSGEWVEYEDLNKNLPYMTYKCFTSRRRALKELDTFKRFDAEVSIRMPRAGKDIFWMA